MVKPVEIVATIEVFILIEENIVVVRPRPIKKLKVLY